MIVALEQRFLDGGETELANGRGVPSRLLFLRTKRSHCRKGRRRLICRSEKAGVGLRRERGERRERSRRETSLCATMQKDKGRIAFPMLRPA